MLGWTVLGEESCFRLHNQFQPYPVVPFDCNLSGRSQKLKTHLYDSAKPQNAGCSTILIFLTYLRSNLGFSHTQDFSICISIQLLKWSSLSLRSIDIRFFDMYTCGELLKFAIFQQPLLSLLSHYTSTTHENNDFWRIEVYSQDRYISR